MMTPEIESPLQETKKANISSESEAANKNVGKDAAKNMTPPATPSSKGGDEKEDKDAREESSSTPASKASNASERKAPSELDDIARKLFSEEFYSVRPDEYIHLLAGSDGESTEIRERYMDLFEWSPDLLASVRMLCSKLYLKGESQQIDRVLVSFSKSYVRKHPDNVFCTKQHEMIYIIMYSLVLLNTALHNSEVDKKSKMSQQDYVRNTMSTFVTSNSHGYRKLNVRQRVNIERELAGYYEDLSKHELHLKNSDSSAFVSMTKPSKRQSLYGNESASRNVSSGKASLSSDMPPLSRQSSESSIWSTDTNSKRISLSMQRVPSGASDLSHMSSFMGRHKKISRAGFSRALASEQKHSSNGMFSNNNSSAVSQHSARTLRGRQSMHLPRTPTKDYPSLSRKTSTDSSILGNGHDLESNISVDSIDMQEFDITKDDAQMPIENFDVDDFQDEIDLLLELEGSPYLKEGFLKLKIVNNDQQDFNAEEQPPSRTASGSGFRWLSFFRSPSKGYSASNMNGPANILSNKVSELFVVVSKGELTLYSFDPKLVKKDRMLKKKEGYQDDDDDNESVVGDGNWLKNAVKVGAYNLCSTYAKLESSIPGVSNSSRIGKSSWSLTFPRVSKKPNKVFYFEAGTYEIAREFINACNFWASKITAIPTAEESVSSIEYGWTNLKGLIAKKNDFKKMKSIQKWEPLPQGVYLSSYFANQSELDGKAYTMNIIKQFFKTVNYYNSLKKHYADFNESKIAFLRTFNNRQLSGSSNYGRVVANYKSRGAEYEKELKMYKSYMMILAYGLLLRFKVEYTDNVENVNEQEEDKDQENLEENWFSENDDEMTYLAKVEISKVFKGVRDIFKLIPNYQSNPFIDSILTAGATSSNPNAKPFPLVKSPKTFTLSNYKEVEGTINDMHQNQPLESGELDRRRSTDTIKEEDEPEEAEQNKEKAK
ncbi:Piso0_003509 [Millerozyma farinosa CBS 7064]|uniref:Piso0_003509 protein n=1 Tax=Pichia sorbitophila (strain ATCC MYA-4447 / BCRC 22081 / CBS 7064 / NBRC 10061 / NRRL Y-12695) TaxID=559304 RepID=G8YIA6_PICSO|nr:Piso0_003509 [Millerozyma farinosa CBS 7064]CCE81158.1 Piso0_003509 [Millerozyma farinosa CBS 7064]